MKIKRMLIKSLLLVTSCLLVVNFIGLEAKADIPERINIQGVLTPRPDAGKKIKFQLYDSPLPAANKVGPESEVDVVHAKTLLQNELYVDEQGFFNVGLPVTDLPFDIPYYLEIVVDNITLEPRQELLAAPYAMTAKNVYGGTGYFLGDPAIQGVSKKNGDTFGMLGYDALPLPVQKPTPTPPSQQKYYYGAYGESTGDNYGALGYRRLSNVLLEEAGVYGHSTNGYGIFADAPRNYFSGQVGVGLTAPATKLHVHQSGSGASYIQITNGVTGKTVSDGLTVGLDSAEQGIVWVRENDNLRFGTNNNERMRITAGGRVGIGTTSPAANLAIESNGSHATPQLLLRETEDDYARVRLQSQYGSWVIAGIGALMGAENAWLNLHYALGAGNVFQVNGIGEVYAANVKVHSDRRLKSNITPLSNVLDKISGLRGVSFEWNEKGKAPGQKGIGMIAQEMEAYYPELVGSDSDGYKAIDYSKFTAVLLEAIKEQQKKIESLEKRIGELEGK